MDLIQEKTTNGDGWSSRRAALQLCVIDEMNPIEMEEDWYRDHVTNYE